MPFPFGSGQVVFQYPFVAVEGNHLAGLFFECHLLQEVFDAVIEWCGGVFVYIFDSVFVEVYPTFVIHFASCRFVVCRRFGGLLCGQQRAAAQ